MKAYVSLNVSLFNKRKEKKIPNVSSKIKNKYKYKKMIGYVRLNVMSIK